MSTLRPSARRLALLVQTAPSPLRQFHLHLLKAFSDSKVFSSTVFIHARLLKTSLLGLVQANHLIGLYANFGQLVDAHRLFDEMPDRNVVSFNMLMAGYLHSGFPEKVLSVFKRMAFAEVHLHPNQYIFATVLATCANISALDEGRQCHSYVLRTGLTSYSYVRNSLLHMYAKCSDMQGALGVFESGSDFDIFSFNSMINGFLTNGQLSGAKEILSLMVEEMDQWDHVSYVAGLGLCADSVCLTLGEQFHGQILRRGMDYSDFVCSAVVDMYGKCKSVQSALLAFRVLPSKNVVSWTTVMSACMKNGCFEEALKLFMHMITDNVQPNELTYAVALYSCAGLSALRSGDALNGHVEKTGFKAYVSVGNALVNMYSKSGSIEDAIRTFTYMCHRDIISWNSIINAYSHFGYAKEALETFHNMLEMPTHVTFVGVLSACAHLGLVDQGFYYLKLMKDLGIVPEKEHYTCMVGLLCRAGQLEEADRFMRSTFTEWDIVAWRTLLSACRVLGNHSLGFKIAEWVLQRDPGDVGTYILLSNMYSKARRWDGVAKIRKLMRNRNIKKEPGISWIQVGNETHVFVSEDTSHPAMKQITKKLAELMSEIKLIGYVPNITSVLHDVDDEQKEEYLRYHSEKLAISFGLLHMPVGATIYVMKNLRMCDDCHLAVKLISMVTNRRLVVRDANRFHCFERGLCSCDDYW
ncbi:pentatricopeptide repeat-containing protein At5g39680-like [Zingiber officinale]|nr:pentatricopeptide repeat-containing protein At5g39680-like [Zingiber officinale]